MTDKLLYILDDNTQNSIKSPDVVKTTKKENVNVKLWGLV